MKAILISNLVFTAFMLLYVVWLKHLTFFKLNRIYLVGSLLISAVIPWLNLPIAEPESGAIPVVQLPAVIVSPETTLNEPVLWTVSWIYWLGVVVAAVFTGIALIRIMLKWRKAELRESLLSKYFVNDGDHAYSFFNRIHLGSKVKSEMHDMILSHELIHQRQWHSIDVMLFTLARVLWWFNPMVHLASREVQLNHEFLADRETFHRFGTDYQYSLLNQAMETKVFPLTNSFFSQSYLKNRILMMNKNQSKRMKLAAYLFMVPILAGGIWLSACSQQAGMPDEADKQTSIAEAMKPGEKEKPTADANQTMPSYPGGQEKMIEFFQENFKYPEDWKEEGLEGRVVVSFVVDTDGSLSDFKVAQTDDERLNEEAISFLKNMPEWEPGTKDGEKVKMQAMLPVQFTNNK